MYQFSPISPRVQRLRDRYRSTIPSLDCERTKIVTEYYQKSEAEVPVIRRARAVYEILSKMTIRVEKDELIVGNIGKYYKGSILTCEYANYGWLPYALESGDFDRREAVDGALICPQEDREYLLSVCDYWNKHDHAAMMNNITLPEEYEALCESGALPYSRGAGMMIHGHFNANYRKVADTGFGAIREEALARLEELKAESIGKNAEKYYFYRAVVICCDAAILFAKRFAAECRRQAEDEPDENRKAELLEMARGLGVIMEKPAENFWQATQAVYLYHLILCLEGSFMGLTVGRADQHVGDYLERDLASGVLTPEQAQEILDCFCLKIANMVPAAAKEMNHGFGAYTGNMRMTLGGRKKDGTDATNRATYMLLQSVARLKLHDPNISLCMHTDSPAELWEAGIETSKLVGGSPTLDNADLNIRLLHERGLSLEDARNFCVIGCVELSGSGCEFANVSGPFSKTHLAVSAVVLMALNDGKNTVTGRQCGPRTGFLSDMTSFDQVKEAYVKQLTYFMDWHFALNNLFEYVGNPQVVVPMASATMDGCMESGKDMFLGGAKYNSTGGAAIGIGTAIDSLLAVKYLVFDKKLCTGAELLDALHNNWEGYEELRRHAVNDVTYFGNGDPEADTLASWLSDLYSSRLNRYVSARSGYRAGLYSGGVHVIFGKGVPATPNGRLAGEAISDGCSPSQGADHCGPTGVASSILALHPYNYPNGVQFCMKFHPSCVQGEERDDKLKSFVQTFFEMGGMQVQYNIISSDIMRKAQQKPEEYRDLVVRVAGFSAYFIELHSQLQNDLIRRTDIQI